MNTSLRQILEELDSRLADSIDKLEEITPDLEKMKMPLQQMISENWQIRSEE